MNLQSIPPPTPDRGCHVPPSSPSLGRPRASLSSQSTRSFSNTPTTTMVNLPSTSMANSSSPSTGGWADQVHNTGLAQTMSPSGLGMEYALSPKSKPSPVPVPRSAVPTRTLSERSPSPHSHMNGSHSMAEAMNVTRSPGLIRRFSRGASNKIHRRTSHKHSLRMRDQSAGPVLMRRRSDSTGASDFAPDVSDFELDVSAEDALEDQTYPFTTRDRANALGISVGRPSNASSSFEGGIAPSTSAILQNGTLVTKLSPKRQKRIYIRLDPNNARVCWHSTNSAKSFFIDDVREVRVGKESRNMRDDIKVGEEKEPLVLSLVCDMPQRSKGASIKTLHFLMPDAFVLKHWTDALSTVTRERIEIMNALSSSAEKSERSMAMAWRLRKGPSTDEAFTLDDAKWMCRMLEINCSDHAVWTHFTRSDTNNTGKLSYAQYQDFIKSFKERKDIQNLYRNIKFGTDLDMDMDSFLDFLKKEQGADVQKDKAYWEGVFDRFARPTQARAIPPEAEPISSQRMLTMQGFQNFLTSSYNSPLAVSKYEGNFDRPLNEYFISSSHNTYLLGRQVRGESSVEGYISTLIKGCRCVEIDCWDGDNGRPMVTHGRTLTSRIPFEDCVSVIAKYAFHTSPYPLIISLEVHCNPEQQKTMVDLMTKYFDGMMITESILTNSVNLPSPEELKRKILIKVKRAEEPEQSQTIPSENTIGRTRARSLSSAFVRTPSTEKHNLAAATTAYVSNQAAASSSETNVAASVSTPRGSTTSGPTNTPSTSSDDSDEALIGQEKPKRRKTSKIIPELGRLGVYAQGIGYTGFTAPEAKTYNHIFSFNESTFNKLCTKPVDTKAALELHNQLYLMRVYPAAKRFDSSNFNPLQTWRRGVQMAALNWQTYDVHQEVNTAMFAAGSDHLGYVLKPEELRRAKHLSIADTIPETQEKKEKKGKKFVKFTVDVISAQRLPRPKSNNQESGMNPYIMFEMYSAEDRAPGVARGEGGTDASARDGSSGIGSPLRKRTKIVEGNGFDPIYNEPISMTVVTKYPSLIFVRWTVHNSPEARSNASTNSGPIAVFTAKLNSLQQGYRHLPLFNSHGEQYRDAKLFVRIKKEAPVALQRGDNTYYGLMDPMPSPRPEPIRADRSWRSRVFSRNPSQRRVRDQLASDEAATTANAATLASRTSSMERDPNGR